MSKINKSNFSSVIEASSKKQTLKEKKTMIEDYMIRYRKAKLKMQCFDSMTIFNQNTIKEKEQYTSYISYIEKVLELISAESKEFFEKEYLVGTYDPLWWQDKYNKATYLKVRLTAFDEFLLYVC